MNAKKIIALALTLLMTLSCLSGMLMVSAEGEDKYAPTNEEKTQMFNGEKGEAIGGHGVGTSFGAKITIPEGKRLTQINFPFLATYGSNNNQILFQVYQWDTDYDTTVSGPVLAQFTKINQVDNAVLDVKLPENRNLTGELLWTATYVTGDKQMTPWGASDETAAENVTYFSHGTTCKPFCFSITTADALSFELATYTVTFVAEGVEVGTVSFYEGDTKLNSIPEVPAKEGFYADWEEYTLDNEDITVNAVYTDASDAVTPEIADCTNVTAFAAEHLSFLRGEGCTPQINRDGTASFVGVWDIDGDIDAYATINYLQLMTKYYEGYTTRNNLPNKSEKFNVVAVKVKAPAVTLDSNSTPCMTVIVGRDTEIYGKEVANTIKCDGTEEYWIFDFSDEPDFTSDIINTMKINWAYSLGEESNLNAEFVIMGFQFFDTLENALTATGGEEATEPPTEEKTQPETEPEITTPETQAPTNETEPTGNGGCGSVIGFGAVAVLSAVAAAVALKKKD